jgi:putative membrane protein
MYYGGDIAEPLLAIALVTTWRPRRHAPQETAHPAAVIPQAGRQTGDQ